MTLVRRNDQRKRIERPRPVGPVGIGVDVVGHPVFLNPLLGEIEASAHFFGRHRIDVIQELFPVRAHLALRR
jgi:hypothetical protein